MSDVRNPRARPQFAAWNDPETQRERITREAEPAGLLVLSPHESDHVVLDRILKRTGRQVYYAYTCVEAAECMDAHAIFLVFCERDLPACGWKDVLTQLASRPNPPLLVVASRVADEKLWAEVLALGGFDVVFKPFDAGEVMWVVDAAEYEWRRHPAAWLPVQRDSFTRPLPGYELQPFCCRRPGPDESS